MGEQAVLRRLVCILLPFFALACGSSHDGDLKSNPSVNYQPVAMITAPDAVTTAAQAGLQAFIGSLGNEWASFGFANSNELVLAQLGTPYQVCILNNAGKSDQAIALTEEWYFPVTVNGTYRCIVTVGKMNDQWQAGSMGKAAFAASLQTLETSRPLLDLTNRGIVKVYGFSSAPYEMMGMNLSGVLPSFLLLPPGTELLNGLPQYSGLASTDPVPAISFEELCSIFSSLSI